MAAFNNILIRAHCPSCSRLATILCQTHVASSFTGDHTGRFCLRNYWIGEKMAWWPKDRPEYAGWRCVGEPNQESECALEACYAFCNYCKGDLYAVIQFKALTPVRVIAIGPESEWPSIYSK
jgi:hypothetical protein